MPATDLAALIRGFFDQHLVTQRGLSGHTVLSYRDTFKLLLEFACREDRKRITELTLADLTAELVHRFLRHLEEDRHNGIVTRLLERSNKRVYGKRRIMGTRSRESGGSRPNRPTMVVPVLPIITGLRGRPSDGIVLRCADGRPAAVRACRDSAASS